MGFFDEFWTTIRSDMKERNKMSAKNLYLLNRYQQIEPDDEVRLQSLLTKQDQFNEAKAVHGYTSATFEVPADLLHKMDEVIKYFKDAGMWVLNIGDIDKVAEGHIFLLWNAPALKQTLSNESIPTQVETIEEPQKPAEEPKTKTTKVKKIINE